ncbi:uncharacterized protein [Pseudorasbora parva]|uniref:uncharacterized protein n=1 Tax=Pseudorasbora parva TaxID=51549 RepID=UPI00351DA97D
MCTTWKVELSFEEPFISKTTCNCKAGLGQCNHLIGLLYTLAHYIKMGYASVPPTASKTLLPQAWHVPSRALGLSPRAVSTVTVSKVKPPLPNAPPKKKQRSTEGIVSNLYCPVPLPLPSAEFAETLRGNLATIDSKCQMLKLLEANCKQPAVLVSTEFGELPWGSILSCQTQRPLSIFSENDPELPLPPQPCSFSTALDDTGTFFYGGLAVTLSDAKHLEMETRGQSSSKTWHQVRAKRLTSSTFKRICSRVRDFDSLADNLKEKRFTQTKAMKRGLEMEPVAVAEYKEITGNEVYPCGFVINPHAPHLGASPDGKVRDLSAAPTYGLLEIKCPDKESFKDCPYLYCKTDGTYALKTIHEYYYQMVGQMGITGMTWCDFLVQCKQDHHLDRVHFNSEEWEKMKCKLDSFFFTYFLPALCKKGR